MDVIKLDVCNEFCIQVPTQSEWPDFEKNYTMLNWSDHFMKKWSFCEIFTNFTKCKISVFISWKVRFYEVATIYTL